MENRIRIGHYMPQFGTNTGTGQVLEKLFRAFENHPFIDLIVFKKGDKFEEITDKNLTFVSFPIKSSWFPPKKILRAVKKNTYKLDSLGIHMPFSPQNFIIFLYSSIPIDYYPHGCFAPKTLNRKKKKLKKKIYYEILEKRILNNSRKIICATEKERTYLSNLSYNNIAIAPFPFSFPETGNISNYNFRSRNGFFKNDFLIVFVGRFDIYTKGLDTLIESIVNSNIINPNVKGILIGYNNYNPKEIDELIIRMGGENCITNLGKRYGKEKFEVLKSCDLYVQSSRYESFGVSILEALSLGIPCLLSDGCDISHSIIKSNGCFTFNGSSEDLTRETLQILENNTQRKEIAQNGTRWVTENLSKEILVKKWEEVFSSNT